MEPIILWRLRLGATSLAKLERDIDGITQKMLLEQLKELMDYGFLEKKSYEGYPLHDKPVSNTHKNKAAIYGIDRGTSIIRKQSGRHTGKVREI